MKDEALRLALEALGHFEKAGLTTLRTIDAITAIKQALEQPEPVIDHSAAVRIATALGWEPKRKPEPEPVALGHKEKDKYEFVPTAKWFGELPDGVHHLYTSPPKREWQGLTDVDVSKILDEQNGFYTFEKCFNFAKAIEAKLKEKNHDSR
jgi:hypothetical protein